MIEADWLECDDPMRMLDFLWRPAWMRQVFGWLGGRRAAVRQRKYRLCICACCRNHSNLIPESAVEVAELFADGLATPRELRDARKALEATAYGLTGAESWWQALHKELSASTWEINTYLLMAASAAELTVTEEMVRAALRLGWCFPGAGRVRCAVLRDLFGTPFRQPLIAPSLLRWNSGVIMKLAQQVYEERLRPTGRLDPARLAVLADALEEAGCSDPGILNHCRQPGEHVRGCWLIDALLGKT
jgi:hypothetical protein